MNYLKIIFKQTDEFLNELLIAALADFEFNGFEEQDEVLVAYIAETDFGTNEKDTVEQLATKHQLSYTTVSIADQNWNAQWESDYQPVLVDDFCAIRATFHAPITTVEHEIVITPKMSFGTGHHATTWMMIKQLEQLDTTNKKVFDYGCGTGVLAILASQRGATYIDAVDIDHWAYENTIENIAINKETLTADITTYCGEIDVVPKETYDLILANINRNVILGTMPAMAGRLNKMGYLLTSGFLEQDITLVEEAAQKNGLVAKRILKREQWRCILFQKN